MVAGLIPVAVTYIEDIALVLSMNFLDIQATTGCRLALKSIYDMIKTHG